MGAVRLDEINDIQKDRTAPDIKRKGQTMKGKKLKNKKPIQGTALVMSFIWMTLALIGIILDPDKNVMITSLITAGLFSFIGFFVLKQKKTSM